MVKIPPRKIAYHSTEFALGVRNCIRDRLAKINETRFDKKFDEVDFENIFLLVQFFTIIEFIKYQNLLKHNLLKLVAILGLLDEYKDVHVTLL